MAIPAPSTGFAARVMYLFLRYLARSFGYTLIKDNHTTMLRDRIGQMENFIKTFGHLTNRYHAQRKLLDHCYAIRSISQCQHTYGNEQVITCDCERAA